MNCINLGRKYVDFSIYIINKEVDGAEFHFCKKYKKIFQIKLGFQELNPFLLTFKIKIQIMFFLIIIIILIPIVDL